MGRIRTKNTKRAAKLIIERFYGSLTHDFQENKRVCDDVASIASKRMRNKVAGYVTHLMRRLERGPVRGISFKLQEMEREKRDNWMPEESRLAGSVVSVDKDTMEMLKAIGMDKVEGIRCQEPKRRMNK